MKGVVLYSDNYERAFVIKTILEEKLKYSCEVVKNTGLMINSYLFAGMVTVQ